MSIAPRFLVLSTLLVAGAIGGCLMAQGPKQLIINGRVVSDAQKSSMQRTYGVLLPAGRYWYDAKSGLWGYEGGGPVGIVLPGHDLGPLSPRASAGNTGVFLNGREINLAEALYYKNIFGVVYQGRFWLDGRTGFMGQEGNPTPLVNLVAVLNARGAQNGKGGCSGFTSRDAGSKIETSVYLGCD